MKRNLIGGVIVVLLITFVAPVAAQEPPTLELPGEVVATDLLHPYGVSIDADGNLWVAQAGNGGNLTLQETDEGTVTAGLTGAVTKVSPDGVASTVFNMPSAGDETASGPLFRVYNHDGLIWLVLASDSSSEDDATVSPPSSPFADAIVAVEPDTNRVVYWIDMWQYEADNDPDGSGELNSNPTDLAWDSDGTLYINDTGANTILSWTPETGLQTFRTWTDDPVPTAIQIMDNGDMYVGFLGQGIAPGAGKVEHWSADGTLLETFSDMTAVTDIQVTDDGTIYAVELFGFDPENPDMPGPGRVVSVTGDGVTPVVEGLPFPYALAQDTEGNLYVTINVVQFGPPMGPGMVLKLAM